MLKKSCHEEEIIMLAFLRLNTMVLASTMYNERTSSENTTSTTLELLLLL